MSLRRLVLCPLQLWHLSPSTILREDSPDKVMDQKTSIAFTTNITMHKISIGGSIQTVLTESVYHTITKKKNQHYFLHLQSHFVEHLRCLQDAGASRHRVFNDETGFPLTNGTLHQTLGSWEAETRQPWVHFINISGERMLLHWFL